MPDKIYWIEENGNEHLLSFSTNYAITDTIIGRSMPPIEVVEEYVPFQAGSRRRGIKIKPRDVDLQMMIKANNEKELKNIVRRTMRMINPLKMGKLKSVSADDSIRELYCQYIGGLEGKEDEESSGFYIQNAILTFHAFDPYWYDTDVKVETYRLNENQATFFPMFPLRLTSSTVFADTAVDNEGDVETWPEWIITGPGENIAIRNMTTGEVIYLDHPDAILGPGETVTINTKPFEKTVEKNDGINIFHTLTEESSLWALVEGNNSIRIEMANATSESSIQLSYRHRYWGP